MLQMVFLKEFAARNGSRVRQPAVYVIELCLIGLTYFALAKGGLALASINPSATPIWPPTGFALAAMLLRGYRVWPAIFVAAFLVNATTAGSLATSFAIGAGNALEGLIGAYLVNRWADGRDAFGTPAGVARFALMSFLPTAVSASIGVGSLALAGYASWTKFGSIWLTWWLGDLAGALVVAPVLVLWTRSEWSTWKRSELVDWAVALAGTCAVGLLAFSPLIEQTASRAPLGFLAILPLLWAALRRGQRDTATAALVISFFAVWGTLAGSGPFARDNLNESFLLLIMFMIATAVPSLALSADVAVRKRAEDELRQTQDDLNLRVEARTAALTATNRALQEEIDRRKQVEADFEQQRVHLTEAQRLANLGSWIRDIDKDSGIWSDHLCEIYGLRPRDHDSSFEGFMDLVHPEDRERVREEYDFVLQTGQGLRSERRIVRPDGEIRHTQNWMEVIKDESGRVVRLLGICQDITEHKQAEGVLRETEERLAQAHKMEALGQLTGGIAHDFNNLLMIVGGHADMLRRRVSEPRALQGLEAIASAARRGENLTRQLLTFSRRQPLSPVVIELKERIEAVRDMLSSSLRGNIALVIDIPDDVWRVKVDVAEFELALVNIAVNARDAMPQGGTFTLTARNVAVRPGRKDALLKGDIVELALSDTGEGIPADVLGKIFDPFFTTKVVGKGTGLGLSQVYGFVRQSGGLVRARSEAGRGAAIVIQLPRSTGAVTVKQDVPVAPGSAPARGTILVVEDNTEVAEVTGALLEQIGYRVLRALNAAEALRLLQSGTRIDLVFSDIVMPNGMNGIHLAQEVSAHYPQIGVLLTTGYSDVAAAAETRFPILRKPFEISALQRAVAEALVPKAGTPPRRAVNGLAT
jgi:PAS domain S-box-containing protein